MVKVEFLGPIKKESISVDVNSIAALKEYFKDDNDLQDWLKICAVAINDKIVLAKDIPLKNGDKISLLPPVCGG